VRRGFQHLGFIPTRLAPWFRWLLLWRRLSAPALSMVSFALLITIGTAGLMWIPGLQAGEKLGFIDSWFTMTSASCITGLTVIDTGTQFTVWGQLWILLFIQLGGIGIITVSTMLIGALGARLSLRSEMLTMMPTRTGDRPEVWQIALSVLKFSLVVEAIGALLLFTIWVFEHPVEQAAWHAVFHAVSAYCNAGFTTFSDSLVGERNLVLIVISALVVIGGLGYLTYEELLRWWGHVQAARRGKVRFRAKHRLSSHTWAVLVTSSSLLLVGWVLLAVFEWHGVLEHKSIPDSLAGSWFMSVTPRSSGFSAVDYTAVGNDSIALTLILMFIGGSPGSTGGGVKTTTIAVLVALGLSRVRGRKFVALKQRSIPEGTIERTVGVMLLAILVLTVTFFALNAIQSLGLTSKESRDVFLPVAFECVSAFSTTGLSMNYTQELHGGAKLVVIGMMFIGRVGLLSFFSAAILRRGAVAHTRPAQEDVMVG
jgi:trk system potassium uptake protein TrkH